jgi:tetratricopeptide (TPR) repeat protein
MIRVVWFLLRLVLLSAVLEAAVVAEDGDDWLTADPAVAAELEQQVSAQTPGGEAPRELCVYLHKRGALLIRLGRYDEAIADFKQALALNEPAWSSADRWCVRFSIHNDLMRAVGDAGDWLTLTDHARSIAAESRSTDKWQYFAMQLRLVDAYVHLGELRQAEEALHEAADTLQGLRRLRRWDTHGANAQSQYHDSAAWLQELRGNLAEAERFRRQAMDSARQYADLMLTSFPPEHYYVQLAQRQICLRQRQLAQVLSLQGKFGEAELLARQALQGTLAHWGKNTAATAKVIGTLASIRLQQGQVGDALRLRELALTTIEKTGARPYSTDLASALREVAFLLGVQNRWPEALNLYGQRDDGLRSHAAQFAKIGSDHLDWAMALTKSQHPTEGEAMLHSLLDYNLKKPFVDPLYLAHLRGYLAVAQMTNGKYDTALGEFREAFPVLVQLAETGTNAESGGFVRRYRLRLIAEAYLDLLSRLADRGTTAGLDPVTEAFRVAEVARGSSVQQAIAKSAARATLPDPALASLARREQDTAHRIGALNNLLVRLASAPTALRLDKTIGEMRRDLEQLSLQHAEMRRELTERYSAYAELVSPRAPAPADLQKALHSDEALVAFTSPRTRPTCGPSPQHERRFVPST